MSPLDTVIPTGILKELPCPTDPTLLEFAMKVSVFTPTNNPTWLRDIWNCLQQQTYSNWEWIVVPNGPCVDHIEAVLNQVINESSQVKIVPTDKHGIGALKRFACEQATGDLFMELDHDDLITDDCLEEVVNAARSSPRASFIFSDDVTLNPDGTSHCFSSHYGWENYEWQYRSKNVRRAYRVNRQFPVTPRSLCEILYAPDHVRVWTRDAYRIVNGHRVDLEVCDDHDLMIRTYLAGIHFEQIQRPLYIHRLQESSTCALRTNEIQEMSRNNRAKYLHSLVHEWCRRKNLPMYDLGGLHNCPDGYTPIDKNPEVLKVGGLLADVMSIIPSDGLGQIADNSVGCFRAFDFLEHIPSSQIPFLMNTLYRKLVPGGWLLSMTPAVCDNEGKCGRGAFQDPTHVSFWSSNNFWYYTRKEQAKFVPEISCRFQAVRLANLYPSEWHRQHLIPYVVADLAALKPDNSYWPGPKEI